MPGRRRKVDTWKLKKWYEIYAPENLFKNMKIGETLADKPEKLVGRRVEISLFELTGDYQHDQIKIIFKITDVLDSKAKTEFSKEYITNAYLKSLVRRGTSRIDAEIKAKTKDGYFLHMFGVVFTEKRVINSIKHAIRMLMKDELIKFVSNSTINEVF